MVRKIAGIRMDRQIATGVALGLSNPIITASATAVGVAKTGTAIGTLSGAAHANATAAWVGFGSMKLGMVIMGALPVIGALLILDGLCGRDSGSPLIDWEEEFWRQYEAQAELEKMKQEMEADPESQERAETELVTLAQLEKRFGALESEHELNLMKQKLGLI